MKVIERSETKKTKRRSEQTKGLRNNESLKGKCPQKKAQRGEQLESE